MTPSATLPRRRSRRRRLLLTGGILLFAIILAILWCHHQLRASLPQLDGQAALPGLRAPVTVERDALGIPTVSGNNRTDVARATGFLHAQERFFQMDLLRRAGAGELAELLGATALPRDRQLRLHRFRAQAQAALTHLPVTDRELLSAYTAGVNAGLAALAAYPFEYLLLRTPPVPWRAEDSLLVIYAMYFTLQDSQRQRESSLGVLHDTLPPALYAFLVPPGTEWDAPLFGATLPTPPIPGPEVFNLRTQPAPANADLAHRWREEDTAAFALGSNNWAVAGHHSRHGGALLADDMHLNLAVPNTWYRASLRYPDDQGRLRRVTGVTLPGMPVIVVGSNEQIAWGFTNTEGDWSDLVILEDDPTVSDHYRTPDGPQPFQHFREILKVKDAPDEVLEVRWTRWGPVIDQDHKHRWRALRWVAHDLPAMNLNLQRLETTGSVATALAVAATGGLPAQNFVVADSAGHIGWTVAGPIPHRFGHDGSLPSSWADGTRGWNGWLGADDYPRLMDPPSGRLWTANARVVAGADLTRLGDGGYDLGARAGQIRDRLLNLAQASEADLLALQLDDRALFLERWQRLLLDVLTPAAVAADPRRQALRDAVANWGGRAAVDSVGYRMVRAFRVFLAEQVFEPLLAAAEQADPDFDYGWVRQREGPLWRLVSEQPAHLLNPRYASWQEQYLAAVDALLDHFLGDGSRLEQHTWGERNIVHPRHPFSRVLPVLSYWLDMPALALPGDLHLPRVQDSDKGASQRMVVSPGREADGIFHTPVGQSGHPLSPHYADSHAAWAHGEPRPFLPGATRHRLQLLPVGQP